jgi:Na+(H+)/acetate symporter ActP
MNKEKTEKQNYTGSVIGVGLVSAIVGSLLGMLAARLYQSEANVAGGWISGCAFGFFVGVYYTKVMFSCFNKGLTRKRFINRGDFMGIVAGVICSTLVHATLMILSGTSSFIPMLIGAVFGILAGFILGAIVSRVLWNNFTEKLSENISDENDQETNNGDS